MFHGKHLQQKEKEKMLTICVTATYIDKLGYDRKRSYTLEAWSPSQACEQMEKRLTKQGYKVRMITAKPIEKRN